MKLVVAAALLLAPLPALAQSGPVTPAAKLPPANPLPYEDAEAAAVLAPINAMFAGLAAHDGAAILAQTRPEGGATVAVEKPDGSRAIRHLSWADFAGGIKPGPEKLEERISTPAIEVDGDIAMVWAPYVFLIDGKAHHCGINHFDLLRENGSWKVLNVTWSQRTTGCTAQ
ncbi:hypothetical protein [Sphingomonas sp. NIBR02145]|uniref:hypothetical protein n=1 Tax=Sphingomonas sp. NIBR02145 TaxID=3014784 RepID=UPI0022B41623|nr:hypothetical protein [Sphingomonas sp. NIBR02145]WHU04069.1 hypothetical protein O3305_05620 [Sphingomonas sp. NIBR02145]